MRRRTVISILLLCVCCFWGCSLSFNMSGAIIDYTQVSTCEIQYIQNNAEIVNATLSNTITEKLRDKIQSDTRLKLVQRNGDVVFSGDITGYTVTSQGATADATSAKDRLTVTLSIRYTNNKVASESYSKNFSQYAEYDRTTSFASAESDLIDEIVPLLIEDIFNASFSNW